MRKIYFINLHILSIKLIHILTTKKPIQILCIKNKNKIIIVKVKIKIKINSFFKNQFGWSLTRLFGKSVT